MIFGLFKAIIWIHSIIEIHLSIMPNTRKYFNLNLNLKAEIMPCCQIRTNGMSSSCSRRDVTAYISEMNYVQSDQQETKSRVLPHLLFYRNVFLSWISRFYLLTVDTRFVGCLPLKNLSLIAFINFL
jgi:hypothetical protein